MTVRKRILPGSGKDVFEKMKMEENGKIQAGKTHICAAALRVERTKPEQLAQVLAVYERARAFMAEHGNPNQWGNSKPPASRVKLDIEEGNSYVCMAGEEIAAVFYYKEGEDPTYREIEDGRWISGEPYGVVHRIASAGIVRGAGSFCIRWAFSRCGNLRIDTHRDNTVMQGMLKKNGFSYCGIIHLEDGDERLAFQKAAPTGLVLEGGGMRGIYTAGVLDVFLEHGIAFDGVLGVSAGAIHGCSYVSGQGGRSIRYYQKYCQDKRFMSFSNLLRRGEMVDTQFCYHEIPEKLDPYDFETFAASPTRFYAGCSNLKTGRPEYIRITDMKKQVDAVRASASLPFVSHIVQYEGMELLDGGCTDSIPIRGMLRMGYRKNVVVLTRDASYVKPPQYIGPGHIVYCRYPRFMAALKRRPKTYNETIRLIRRLEQEGKAFVICPSRVMTISRTCRDPEEILRAYELGRGDAEARLAELRKFLEG